MTTVTLTRVLSGFANVPPGWHVGRVLDPETDANVEHLDYILPSGFEVAQSAMGALQIYKGNDHCDIVTHTSGRPQLVCSDQRHMPVLERAS